MPITTQSILPRDAATQIATGTDISTGATAASVRLDGGTDVKAAVPGSGPMPLISSVAYLKPLTYTRIIPLNFSESRNTLNVAYERRVRIS